MAAARLAWSLERAVAPPPPLSLERIRNLAVETGDDNLAGVISPRVLSPPWDGSADNGSTRSDRGGTGRGTTHTSASSAESSTASRTGVVNNWSKEVPLPRLALLSGRTSLRLNVAMAGVQVRLSSRGLLGVGGVAGARQGSSSGTEKPGATLENAFSSPKKSGESDRTRKARRCIRRIARQLVERIHPASASAGYQQACRLFRDEMGALGYDQSALTVVIKALVETTARTRDPEGQDGSGDGREGFLFSPPPSPPAAAGQQEAAASETPGGATLPGELDETRELVDAGMAVLPKLPVSLDGDGGGGKGGGEAGEEKLLLDIASVEVRICFAWKLMPVLFFSQGLGVSGFFPARATRCTGGGMVSVINLVAVSWGYLHMPRVVFGSRRLGGTTRTSVFSSIAPTSTFAPRA